VIDRERVVELIFPSR